MTRIIRDKVDHFACRGGQPLHEHPTPFHGTYDFLAGMPTWSLALDLGATAALLLAGLTRGAGRRAGSEA